MPPLPDDCIARILCAAHSKDLARAAAIAREWNHSAQVVAHDAVMKHQHATLGTATRALLERLPKETWINVLRFAEDVDQCAMCDKLVASFSRPGTRQAAQCVDCDFLATSLCSMCIDVWEDQEDRDRRIDVWEDEEDRDRRALEIQSHPGFLQEHAGALCVRCHGYLCAGCLHPDCDTPEGMMCGECLGHTANACPYPMTSHCYC
jgi:hypothetical protein